MNSLGFDKAPDQTRIVVAMSGGVDSSVTAALLAEQGYDVVGITLQLYDHGLAVQRKGACCAGQDIYDARNVAETIGIPHYVLDYESKFSESVMDDFADSYLRGETPIPCVKCNQSVKFRDLLATAKDLHAEALVTGHYVRRVMSDTGAELHRAVDDSRDQSYFLFATTQEQLNFLRFPLGDMKKTETRALAERFKLPVAAKPDSQDICFVPDGDYASVVARLRPHAIQPGDIVDLDGRVLASHEGIIHFTIGQRRGLNISDREGDNNDPLYVVRLEPDTRRVVVGPREALAKTDVRLRDMNWLVAEIPAAGMDVTVRLRSSQPPVAARLTKDSATTAQLTLYGPVYGIAPGQAGVIYQGDRVLGGGWIVG